MKCRHCEAELALPLVDLGHSPPSNAYVSSEGLLQPEISYPLKVYVCERCWLVQTLDFAAPVELFTKDYAYFSSYSSSWISHAKRYVHEMVSRFHLGRDSHVLEVASNDGYLLQFVNELGIPCTGIEPTNATAAAARAKGISTVEAFLDRQLARQLISRGLAADLVVCNNVLAHVPDINDFVASVALLLKPAGVVTVEFPHLMKLIAGAQFDTIYHEHFSYLSLTAVSAVFVSCGLRIFDIDELPTHGGSLRIYACRNEDIGYSVSSQVSAMLAVERAAGVDSTAYYSKLQRQAEVIKHELLDFLLDCARSGHRVAGYGAAAKGNTLLNFAGCRSDLLWFVADRNPAKQGKYLPGSHIPIVAPERIKEAAPQYILVLPWNLLDEVREQLHFVRGWGAKFVTAVPKLSIT